MKTTDRIIILISVILLGGAMYLGFTQSADTTDPQQITVNGEGKILAEPDTLTISTDIYATGSSTKEAQDVVNTTMKKLVEALKNAGIPETNIKTTNFSVYPEYNRADGKQEFIDYRADQYVEIKVNGSGFVQKGEEVMNQIPSLGNILINGTTFSVEDTDAAMNKAREKAFTNAEAKAQQLADLANLKLGNAISITDVSYDNGYYPMYKSVNATMAMNDVVEESVLTPGQNEITLTLNVVFEMK